MARAILYASVYAPATFCVPGLLSWFCWEVLAAMIKRKQPESPNKLWLSQISCFSQDFLLLFIYLFLLFFFVTEILTCRFSLLFWGGEEAKFPCQNVLDPCLLSHEIWDNWLGVSNVTRRHKVAFLWRGTSQIRSAALQKVCWPGHLRPWGRVMSSPSHRKISSPAQTFVSSDLKAQNPKHNLKPQKCILQYTKESQIERVDCTRNLVLPTTPYAPSKLNSAGRAKQLEGI